MRVGATVSMTSGNRLLNPGHPVNLVKGRIRWLLLIVFLLCALTLGCSKQDEGGKTAEAKQQTEASAGPVAARVGQAPISVAELREYAAERSPGRGAATGEEVARRYLDELVTSEVLYQEALRLGLDREPEIHRSIRQMLTQRLLNRQVTEAVLSRKIEETKLRRYYDRHVGEFSRPEQLRLADIFIAVPAGATAEEKGELRKKAGQVLAEAVAMSGKRTGFGSLVAQYSDRHANYGKGDTGFFDKEGKPVGIDRKLAEAAFGLERVGNLGQEVVETPDGYHIIMLVGRRSAQKRPLAAVKSELERRIRREAVTKARKAYIESLKQKDEIQIDALVAAEFLADLKDNSGIKPPFIVADPKRFNRFDET